MGGNNLNKNGLHKEDMDSYGELINGLRAELPDATIVITALFLQRGLEARVIEQANNGLRVFAFRQPASYDGQRQGSSQHSWVHQVERHPEEWHEVSVEGQTMG
jgi:platelet-activating factor acetylhydrolase IB subunit beta/gamma